MILAILLIFSTVFTMVVTNLSLLTSTTQSSLIRVERKTDNMAEVSNLSEALRAQIKRTMKEHKINSIEFLRGINCALDSTTCPSPLPDYFQSQSPPSWASYFTNSHDLDSLAVPVTVRLIEASLPQAPIRFAEFQADLGRLGIQSTKTIRLNLGGGAVFSNAMTGNTFKCLMCHVRIYGNVAEYYDHHQGAGGNQVHGTWYTAGVELTPTLDVRPAVFHNLQSYPDDDSDVYTPYYWDYDDIYSDPFANSTIVKSKATNYEGPLLPWNTQRQERMLPKMDPDVMVSLAHGQLRGGIKLGVPYGGTYSPPGNSVGTIEKTYEGNLILNGRDGSPLQIDGSVFVRGDVIIFGKVQGKGSIYSGGNIYIPDDIEYVNPPDIFSGTAAQNNIMYNVDTQAQSIADSIPQDRDQLALFSANHTVLGNPFREDAAGKVITESGYILGAGLIEYDHELAIDRSTGFVMDSIPIGNNQLCFLLPWSDPTTCIPQSESNFNQRVQVTSVRDYYNENDPGVTPQIWAYQKIGHRQSDMYSEQVYPKNMVNGQLKTWITRNLYNSVSANSAEHAKAQEFISFRQRRHYKVWRIAWPSSNPYDFATLDANTVYSQIENTTGAFSEMVDNSGNPLLATNNEGGSLNVRQQFLRFVDQCRQNMLGDGTPHRPITNLGGMDHTTLHYKPNLAPYKEEGVHVNFNGKLHYIYGGGCEFYYYRPVSANPDGWIYSRSRLVGRPHNWAEPADPALVVHQCTDIKYPIMLKYDQNAPLNSCLQNEAQTDWLGPPDARMQSSVANHMNAQFAVKIFMADYPQLIVESGYWDPAKIQTTNRLYKIEAFLFSNQFVIYNADTSADRQLRIHGGIVAKDFFGRMLSKSGYYRTYTTKRPAAGGLSRDAAAFPSLILIQDPRFQFDVDIINQDFGRLEYVE